ncbi:hypothetical protein MKK88_29690 [Methylobacterium sp. E-005]|uniref:hypothetical protein n=1 Tax=Methylobacterium sp. E-005 TaxID=2836549 RepID=UPI001FB9C04B|nr:hypothetical protein [Methylobacterium sp. E-005]MCJ2090124.1 hypothetical protein [Methylobacterium sp. E-005]
MFENLFWGATLTALIGAAALVAIGAAYGPRAARRDAEAAAPDPRRSFGRKRGWRFPRGAWRLGSPRLP